MFFLLMGPFGSDQSRHVDAFGANKHNFDDVVAKKLYFRLLLGELMIFFLHPKQKVMSC